MRRSVVLLVMVIGFCGSSVASGAELNVPSEYANIQAGIDAASDGDTVLIADGTYTGDGNRDIDFNGKAITVRSENGPEKCIISCQAGGGQHRGFIFHSGEDATAVVQGFTVTGGNATNVMSGFGGGIYCVSGSSPTISSNIIRGNNGGGISCGSAIGDTSSGASPVITGNTIAENTKGGIVCLSGSSPSISGNSVAGNNGSGITVISSSPAIISNNILNNSDSGIRCSAGAGTVDIIGNVISGNTSTSGGGGISSIYCSPRITNNVIIGNRATNDGGGIFIHEELAPVQVVVSNNTVASNLADGLGGGVYWYTTRDGAMTGCIVRGNAASEGSEISLRPGATGTVTVSYSNVAGGQEGVYADGGAALQWGSGNIDADPLFANPGGWDEEVWTPGDYHLQSRGGRWAPNAEAWTNDPAHSPCIDAAKPTADFAAEPFPNGERANMGTYGGTAQASKSHPNADVNNDACVNVADLLIVRNDLGSTSSPGVELLRADVNGDGVVNVADLLFVRNRLGEGGGCP